ncbi:GNAT family N-acetyltransferase [Rhodococcus sp. NPDC058514]|uniref:GNAT family N-acetyltransferase n=1 Tax=unclassified Rhodococcus (in: high G+C Gram-positive bacteria) TaxID=192944 RepID=UPI0036561DF9
MAAVSVRPAVRPDVQVAALVLATAFHDDPVMVWLWPDGAARRSGLKLMFGALIRHHHLPLGGVEIAVARGGVTAGAALWDPPGRWRQSFLSQVRTAPSMIRAFGGRMKVGAEVSDAVELVHPEEPHWYLSTIGTLPSARGGGLGKALLSSRLDRCDAEHAPAYLESSKESNVPYYERFGFEVTGEIVIPNGGPTLWAMWRTPR